MIAVLAAAIAAVILFAEPRALSVVEVDPPLGAADVDRGAQVTVTFSRPLDEASARGGLSLAPAADGLVSVVGRRAAFTPRAGFRGGTDYTITVGASVRDRGGLALASVVVSRFRTRPVGLVLRTREGRLQRAKLGAAPEPLVDALVEAFAVSREGALAYVALDHPTLVVTLPGAGAPRRLALPAGAAVRDLEWAPDSRALMVLVAAGDAVGVPYLVRLDAPTPRLAPFGPPATSLDPTAPLVTERLKKSLVEIVYRRESFAFTPDGGAAIVRDQNWDFAVIGLDGQRRASVGPFVAVGNTAPGGHALAVVDVNPADPALPRRVLAYGTDGRARPLSAPAGDSHSPRFAHGSDRVVFATGPATGVPAERRYALEIVDVASGARRRLTGPPAGGSDDAPRWSPDDAWILFRRATAGAPAPPTVWIVASDGGEATPLGGAVDARWSP